MTIASWKPARCACAQRGEHAGHEADLLEGVHLFVGRLLDERAVAVDEQHLRLAQVRLRIRRSFCSGVPTEMRSDCGETVRMSRISSFAARAAASARFGIGEVDQQEIRDAGPDLAHRLQFAPARRAARSRSARTCATRSRWMASCGGASVASTASIGELRDGIGRDHLGEQRDDVGARRSANRRARRPGRRPSTRCAARRGSESAPARPSSDASPENSM